MNKKNWDSYTDEDNMEFAKAEYTEHSVKAPYAIGKNNETAGYVQQKYGFDEKGNNDTSCEGMQAYVVTPEKNQDFKDVKQVAVVYQGSNDMGTKDGNADWFGNDLKVGAATEINRSGLGVATYAAGTNFGEKDEVTPQLKESAKTLDKVCEEYPNAEVYVYGQSLGSMDGQYATAATKYPDRIKRACLYEGPNIFPDLSLEHAQQALKMKDRVYNYQDSQDLISLGYFSFDPLTIGKLIHVDGVEYLDGDTISQHMWGGYQFTSDGKLKTQSNLENLLETPKNMVIRLRNAVNWIIKGVAKMAGVKGMEDAGDAKIKIEPSGVIGLAAIMITYVDQGLEEIKSDLEKKKQEFEDDWEATLHASMDIGRDLSVQEVHDALAEVGVTRKTMVDEPQDVLENLKKEIEERQESLTQFADKIKQAATRFEAGDEEVAGLWG